MRTPNFEQMRRSAEIKVDLAHKEARLKAIVNSLPDLLASLSNQITKLELKVEEQTRQIKSLKES